MNKDELIRWLKRVGIQFGYNPLTPYAEVRLTDEAYVINLGREFGQLSPDQQTQVLLHELGHIIRGDLLAQQMHEDAEAWNLATDSVINESLTHLHGVAVTYAALREEYPQLPEMLQPASVTYSIIRSPKERKKRKACRGNSRCGTSEDEQSDGRGDGSGEHGDQRGSRGSEPEHQDNGGGQNSSTEPTGRSGGDQSSSVPQFDKLVADYSDRRAAEQTHNRTLVEIAATYSELPQEYRDKSWGLGGGKNTQKLKPRPIATQSMVAAIERMIRRVAGKGGSTRAYRRTYRRVRYGLPLRIPVPSVDILLAIDVSQSLSAYYQALRYIAQTLSRRYSVSVVAWDISWQRVTPYGEWPKDRGTYIDAAYDAIRAIDPDIAVIVTDGVFTWVDPDVPSPILWVITPDGRDPLRLRPTDYLVRLDRA